MKFLNQFRGFFYHSPREKKRRTPQSLIPRRLTILMWLAGILLFILAGRLFVMQVLQGSSYKAEVKRSDTSIQTNNVQRGMIYDSTGKVMVGNQTHQAIEYTKGKNVSTKEMYKTATRLSKYVKVNNHLTKRNQMDYYLAPTANLKKVEKLAGAQNMTDTDKAYDKALAYLKAHPQMYKLTSEQKNAARIFASMSGAYSLSTTYIKETGVTGKELAQVGEHLSSMPGVKIGTAWTRNYPQGKSVKSITGTVSNSKSGLPSDEVNTLLSQGYSRNDSVGQSYLERQYQSTLAGSKSQTQVTSGNNGKVAKSIVKYAGKKGDNLQLTINAKFQQRVQQILEQNYGSAGISYSTGCYAVVMNPYTGAIYAMAGIDRNPETGKQTTDQIGAINHPITMGSVVKAATVMGGFMSHAITPENNTMTDQPIVTGGMQKSSWFNKKGGANMSLTAPEALEVSSNSYMMQIAMREGGMDYHSGAKLTLKPSIFKKERYYFNMFGLGEKTGVDLPGEVKGYEGPTTYKHIGNALDEAYGNYDGYTVLQLAQYMSTIANGGYRMQPYIVQAVRGTNPNGTLGRVAYEHQPVIQLAVPASKAYFDLVHEGLYLVVHGTNAYVTGKQLAKSDISISGKTGTAETYYKKHNTVTLSFAGYAPSDHPQVVVALAIPGSTDDDGGPNMTMASEIFKAYFKDVQSEKGGSSNIGSLSMANATN